MTKTCIDPARSRASRTAPLTPDVPRHASIKLVGLGGVGGIVARYGAVFLASLDRDLRLVLIDGDAFEPANAARMLYLHAGNKAEAVQQDLLDYLADASLSLMAIPEYVTAENLDRLVAEGDIVLLAVDNHATRKLVSDFCATRRDDVVLISGGNDGVDTGTERPTRGSYGNVQVYVRRDGRDVTPALTALHPEIETPQDHLPTERNCTELVVSTPQILFANLMVASAMLSALWLVVCDALHYGEICFDIVDGLMRPLPFLAGNLPGRHA